MIKISVIFFLSLSILNYNLIAKKDYFAPQNILKFADSLHNDNDFEYAIGEYKRYLYLFPEPPENTDLIYHKIGTAYLHLKKFNDSFYYFNTIISHYPLSIYMEKSLYNIAYSSFLQKKFNESNLYIENNLNNISNIDVKNKINKLMVLNYIYMKEFNKAEQNINKFNKNKDFQILKEITISSKKIRKKNKIPAGILSAIIPGTGKVYCGRTLDGIFSFALIGLLAYQSYDGFKQDGSNSIRGWISASLGGVFYLGNIYGSIIGVNVFNSQQEKKFFENVHEKTKYMAVPDY